MNAAYTFDTITIQNYGNLATGSSSNIVYTTLDWSNKGIITDNGGTLAVVSGGSDLTVPATSKLVENMSKTFNSLIVSGTLTNTSNSTAETYILNITVTNNFTLIPAAPSISMGMAISVPKDREQVLHKAVVQVMEG